MATITTVFTTINGMLVHEDRGGVETEYVSDPLGSLVECRNSSGTKTYEAEYWPYGEVQTSTGTNPSSWGYVGLLGYLTDLATLIYVRARYFLNKTARWLTVDTYWPSESPYGYVEGKPGLYIDPTGMQRGCPHHGGYGKKCVYNGPPGGESDPAYWHCSDPLPNRDPGCILCLMEIKNGMERQKIYPGGRGFDNAMRHCVGSCLASQRCGQSCAGLEIIHEFKDFLTDDSRRDRHNNQIGFEIGQKRPLQDCHKRCGEKWKSHDLL